MRACKNDLIIDPSEGSLIRESEAYLLQPSEVISTGDAVLSGPGVLQPVTSCDAPLYCCREMLFENYFSTLTVGGIGTDELAVVAQATCTDLGATMTIDWGDASPSEPILPLVPLTHSVVGLADGTYKGTLINASASGDARLEFLYTVEAEMLINISYARTTQISIDLTCALAPDYIITFTDSASADNNLFSDYACTVNGSTVESVAVDPITFALVYNAVNSLDTDLDVIITVNTSVDIPITSTSVFKTKCIS